MATKTTPTKKAAKTTAKAAKKAVKRMAKKAPKKAKAVEEEEKQTWNVSDHVYVPKHEVLSPDDVAEFFEKHKLQPTSLPTIFVNDAALQNMSVKMGDIIRITRESPTAEVSVFYRRVAYE